MREGGVRLTGDWYQSQPWRKPRRPKLPLSPGYLPPNLTRFAGRPLTVVILYHFASRGLEGCTEDVYKIRACEVIENTQRSLYSRLSLFFEQPTWAACRVGVPGVDAEPQRRSVSQFSVPCCRRVNHKIFARKPQCPGRSCYVCPGLRTYAVQLFAILGYCSYLLFQPHQ